MKWTHAIELETRIEMRPRIEMRGTPGAIPAAVFSFSPREPQEIENELSKLVDEGYDHQREVAGMFAHGGRLYVVFRPIARSSGGIATVRVVDRDGYAR